MYFTLCLYVYAQDEDFIWGCTWRPEYTFDTDKLDYKEDENATCYSIAKALIKKKKIIPKDLEVHE